MKPYNSHPLALVRSVLDNWDLIWQMSKREVIGRYRGSFVGLLWSFVNPLFMLAVFTFVFSVVFRVRWGVAVESKSEFAVVLFAGLIVHSFFSECITRAPWLILSNVNYVKKVVFPLEVLACATVVGALFHTAVSAFVLVVFYSLLTMTVHATALLFPVVILPFVLMTLGATWFLASLSVYLRDVAQLTGIISTALLFLSPILYPISAVPEQYRHFVYLSPLTFVINQGRDVLLWGKMPDWWGLGLYYLVSAFVAWLGFFWFQKTRRGFADVL